MNQLCRLVLLTLLVASLSLPTATRAQQERLCFPAVPTIADCIEGRFRAYWEQQGGLGVFGFPITAAAQERSADTGESLLTQWFERNRFEAHPQQAVPYDVQLGRLGAERLLQLGRDWFTFAKADPAAPHFFAQTGHAIAHEPFWRYWSSHGLEFDGQPGSAEAESLALFGLPLSEPALETNAAGDTVLTQWFERVRLEDHGVKGVLLGLLGREVRETPQSAPVPPLPASPPAAPACEGVPAGVNGTIMPACVRSGELLTAVGQGFQPGERVAFYASTPASGAFAFPVWLGSATPAPDGTYQLQGALPRDTAPGIYALVLQGTSSNRTAVLAFRILPMDPATSAKQDYSRIPEGINARANPDSGPRGTTFTFTTSGFEGETVGVYLTFQNGAVIGAPFTVGTDRQGNIDQRLRLISELSDPVGVVTVTFEGVNSGKKAYAYLRYDQ